MKKVLLIIGSLIAVIIVVAVIYLYPTYQWMVAVETVSFDPHLTVYLGGGNSIVLTSEDGSKALVVDTKMRSAAQKLRDYVKAANITIVNTHAHSDHAVGNSLFPNAKIIAGEYSKEQWALEIEKGRYPDETIRPGEEKIIPFDDEKVHIRNIGHAHTTNDVVVYLEKRKILVTGDLVFNQMHPAMFTKSHCNTPLWIAALDDLYKRYDITTLVPGHGRVTDKNAILQMKDYFVSISDAIGNPEKIKSVKKKFKGYFALPSYTSFDKSVKFIENEKKQK